MEPKMESLAFVGAGVGVIGCRLPRPIANGNGVVFGVLKDL